ncbi:MAG: conjugative transfer protein MobI(A/C) [Stenotrophomonas sp.]
MPVRRRYALLSWKLKCTISMLRKEIFQEALSIAEEFHVKRVEIAESFSNLNAYVRERNDGRSVEITWVLYHFRNGNRTGRTQLKKHRGVPGYDIATLKLNSPEWLHGLAIETELRFRPLRETLLELTVMERRANAIATRLTQAAPDAPEDDMAEDDEIFPPWYPRDFVDMQMEDEE